MSINYPNLRCCIEQHPSWPGATDATIAAWVNEPSISYRPDESPVREMWDVIIQLTDYEALTDGQRDLVRTTFFGGWNQFVDISDNNTPVSKMLIRLFAGSPTLTALNTAFTSQKSPGNEHDVGGLVNADHVTEARTYPACGA